MQYRLWKRLAASSFGLAGLALVGFYAQAQQQDFDAVEIKTTQLAPGFYMLEGQGGNIGLSVGEDGVLMIDDQFAPLTPKIRAAIEAITDQPVQFLINTHHHPDHVGGNGQWAEAGATIVAHDNVRARLAHGYVGRGGAVPPAPQAALPVVTFDHSVTFHWNGDTVHVVHVPSAHTDGDSLVYFENADVLHTGDVFRTTSYPFADLNGGGSLQGILNSHGRILAIAGPDTTILPGHGVASSRQDVADKLNMMVTIRDRVARAKYAGMSLEEIKAQNLTAEYDDQWSSGFATGDVIVEVIYNELP